MAAEFNSPAAVAATLNRSLVEFCIDPTNLTKLAELDLTECRQILPFLTRIWIRSSFGGGDPSPTVDSDATTSVSAMPVDQLASEDASFKMSVYDKIRRFDDTNRICSYLNADFAQIYEDVIRHLSARKKSQTLSSYTYAEFESASPTAKLLMVANILLNGNIRTDDSVNCKYNTTEYSLFDFDIYFQDLSDLLCIIHAELGEVISLSQFVFTLLHTQHALCVNYILNLMANSIDCIFQVVDIILEGCTCTQIEAQRSKCLLAITDCWPSLASYVIYECIRRHTLPGVILLLSRNQNLIHTLLSMFQFESDRNWFVQFLRSPYKNALEKQSVDVIREDLVAACYKCKSTPQLDLQLFKLYSALRTFAGLKFNEAEVKALIELILNTNEVNVAISFLLIYPPLYESDSHFQRIIVWMKEKFAHSQQSILLVAIYCNSMQLKLLSDYVSHLIGFRIQLKGNSLNLSRVFQQVFPDDMLLNEYMRNLPITTRLTARTAQSLSVHNNNNNNNNQTHSGSTTSSGSSGVVSSSSSSSSLGVYFLNQWIRTNTFMNKRHIDLSRWLFEQIKQCDRPLHPVMLSLINNYVLQLFNLNILSEHRLVPLSSALIFQFFKENYADYDAHLTAKLLLFYYLLVYETKRRETLLTTIATLQNPGAANASASSVAVTAALSASSKINLDALLAYRYTDEIFEWIPINYLLLRSKEPDFLIIYPSLLRFVINLFTQLCQVEHCLYESARGRCGDFISLESILDWLRRIKRAALRDQVTRNEAQTFKRAWLRAYSMHGRKLSLKTASILLDLDNLKFHEMYSNPLILLKSEDLNIYKCGPLFEVLLYILKECLAASRNEIEFFIFDNNLAILSESKAVQYNQMRMLKEKQELKNPLMAAQDAAVIQILLDLLLLVRSKSNELVARQAQCVVCSFLHQMFIENSNVAELVHFQGYPKQLIPILVSGVPSMHICLDFVPKLLANSDMDKQIFAINLAACLCEKYPIVKTFNVAKLSINVAHTVLQMQTHAERVKFFGQIVGALVVFYRKLPPLTHECMTLLINAMQTKSIDVKNLPALVNFEA